jgi:putative ATPase
MAIERAFGEVKNGKVRDVLNHLRDSSLGKTLGRGQGYKYPHDFDGHYVEQDYWPDAVELYVPTKEGYEGKIHERLFRIAKKKDKT